MSDSSLPTVRMLRWRAVGRCFFSVLFPAAYLIAVVPATLAGRAANRGWPGQRFHFADICILIALVATTGAIFVCRRHPVVAVLACGAGMVLQILFGFGLQYNALGTAIGFLVLVVLQTSLARQCDWQVAVVSLLTTVVVAGVAVGLTRQLSLTGTISGVCIAAVILTIATAVGVVLRFRDTYSAETVRERQAAEARERELLVGQAAADARADVAREMHDVIAHSLTVAISLADQSAALVATDPDRSRDTMVEAGETGRRSLAEVRRMLGAVRDPDPATRVPNPGWAELPALVEGFRVAGLPVDLRLSGEAGADDAGADEAVDLAVYRIVQEALTNSLRHGREVTGARVVVDRSADGTIVEVTDDGGGVGVASEPSPEGRGISGMRERAVLFGGTVDAGEIPSGGGWRVRAWLPSDHA